MVVERIEPHGFCWGVKAAVEKASAALAENAPPVFCLHSLVHNSLVVDAMKGRGMVFVDSVEEVPRGAVLVFSAHGVSPAVRAVAEERGLKVVDATCPFVVRAHRQLEDFARRGVPAVVVGNAEHVEVRGLVGEMAGAECSVVRGADDVASLVFDSAKPVGVVCQTTLSGDVVDSTLAALRGRFPLIEVSSAAETCTATRDRQEAVRAFVKGGGDGVLVLGSPESSNTRRLAEIAEAEGARVWRAGTEDELAACDFAGVACLGVTSGASTPEEFFERALATLAT